jgi:beta-lactamase regulating signal transducer with metallopeptidase domain
MMAGVINHLWQSSAFAVVALLLALGFRRHSAQVRYRIWLAASLKFLIPFSAAMLVGGTYEWRTAPEPAPPVSTAIVRIAAPAGSAMPAAPAAPGEWLPLLLAALWFAGCAAVTARWWTRCREVRAAIDRATVLPIAAPVTVLSSPARLEPGVFGVLRPVLLLPDGLLERFTPAQFQAILMH